MAADRLAEAPTNLELTAIGGTHSSSLTQPHGDDQPFLKARRTATQSTLEDDTIQGSGRVSDPVRRPKGPGKLTSEHYANRVVSFSTQTASHSLFSGVHHADLGKFLISPYRKYSGDDQRKEPANAGETFLTLYDLDLRGDKRITHFTTPAELEAYTEHTPQNPVAGRLLFLKGFPSAQWLNLLGAKYEIDPEFFVRHLSLQDGSSGGSPGDPSLLQLSSTANIFQLRILTVGSWDTSRSRLSVEELRRHCNASIMKYHEDLRMKQNMPMCASMVRGFLVLDKEHFSLEQTISILLVNHCERWTAVIWTDVGSDLSTSRIGPWIEAQKRLAWVVSIHPVFQHRSRIALRSRRHASSNSESSGSGSNNKLPQSACLLPLKYGQFLDEKLMELDPFYALHDLFQFAAASELQFLSLIKRKITMISGGTGEGRVLELQVLKATLDEHNEILADNLETIKARGSTTWPGVSSYFRATASQSTSRHGPDPSTLQAKADLAATQLEREYTRLLSLSGKLSRRCKDCIDAALEQAMYRQTQRTISLTQAMAKLTLLAFFFVPLSFTTSFFGMNFIEMEQGKLRIWVWFVVSVPLLIAAGVFWWLDIPRVVGKGWKRGRGMVRRVVRRMRRT